MISLLKLLTYYTFNVAAKKNRNIEKKGTEDASFSIFIISVFYLNWATK